MTLPKELQYYSFDWDDNLLHMPSKIYLLKNWEKVAVSTMDFAKVRKEIWKGEYVLLPGDESFVDFRPEWDKKFFKDSFEAPLGPSWLEFVKCINKASIFSIITARGNSAKAIKETIAEMIRKEYNGINRDQVFTNMIMFMQFAKNNGHPIDIVYDSESLLDAYMELQKIYPVSNKEEMKLLWIDATAVAPEEAKKHALSHFVEHIHEKVDTICTPETRPTLKIWFSDDDLHNVENMKVFMEKGWLGDKILPYLYHTTEWKINKIDITKKSS